MKLAALESTVPSFDFNTYLATMKLPSTDAATVQST